MDINIGTGSIYFHTMSMVDETKYETLSRTVAQIIIDHNRTVKKRTVKKGAARKSV